MLLIFIVILGLFACKLAEPVSFRHVAAMAAAVFGEIFKYGIKQSWPVMSGGAGMLCFSIWLTVLPILVACLISELVKHQGKHWYWIALIFLIQMVVNAIYAWEFYSAASLGGV